MVYVGTPNEDPYMMMNNTPKDHADSLALDWSSLGGLVRVAAVDAVSDHFMSLAEGEGVTLEERDCLIGDIEIGEACIGDVGIGDVDAIGCTRAIATPRGLKSAARCSSVTETLASAATSDSQDDEVCDE